MVRICADHEIQNERSMKGGKRKGAGRPLSPPRPKPVSWRPQTEAQRAKYLRLGGAKWIRAMLEKAK